MQNGEAISERIDTDGDGIVDDLIDIFPRYRHRW